VDAVVEHGYSDPIGPPVEPADLVALLTDPDPAGKDKRRAMVRPGREALEGIVEVTKRS
jgi:hypothetical protein